MHLSSQSNGAPDWLKPALLLLFAMIVARFGWLSDDAYISLRSVRNLVDGHGLTWNPDERVQAYTNPLWVLLLAALHALSREIFLTTILASVAISTLAVAVVLRRQAGHPLAALAFVAMLLLSQAVVDYATSGLENPLSYLLAAAFCTRWLRGDAVPGFRLFLLGGLLALNRLDLVLLVLPALALTLMRQRSRRAVAVALAGLLPLLAWEVFALVYYGFPFPNTYYAKLHTGISAAEYRQQGLVYLLDLLNHDPGTLLLVLLGIVVPMFSELRRQLLPLSAGLLLYLIYVVSVGGDFMQGRFLAVPAFIAAVLLVQTAAAVDSPAWARLAPPLLMFVLGLVQHLSPDDDRAMIRANGIADERRFYFADNALVRYRRDQPLPMTHPFFREGLALRADASGETVFVRGAIGMTGFMARDDQHIVDCFALADAFLARLPAMPHARIGHFQREVPAEYLDSLRSGENRFRNAGLAQLYAQLRTITRGPLWSRARWQAIVALNLGQPSIDLSADRIATPVALAALAEAKAGGYRWDGPGTVTMPPGGVDIELGALRHSRRLSTSLDNNDGYRLRFLRAGEMVGQVGIPAVNSGDGLAVQEVDVPQAAVDSGYDHVQVLPEGGDQRYAIGHLLLDPD